MNVADNSFCKDFGLDFPLVMAPMFLVSNEAMMLEGMKAGIMSTFPSLNYRDPEELRKVLQTLINQMKKGKGSFGVNLITQNANPYYKPQLKICSEFKIPFYTTSLGDPTPVIEVARSYGGKVYCDITNLRHAEISFKRGCDGFIAVGQGAGGHAGPYPVSLLTEALNKHFPGVPVIAAGGISTGIGMFSAIGAGADAVAMGTRFIATEEASVRVEYKEAIKNSGMKDIVLSERISGTPCSIINTPYAQKIGTRQNFIERFLSQNKQTKKLFKMLIQKRGLGVLEKSVFPGNYETLWTAGQSVEMIDDIRPVKEVIEKIKAEYLLRVKEICDQS